MHALMSDPLLSPPLPPFQSCHRYNGDRGLEVNDPVAPSLGRRSLPRAGLGPVPPLRSSQEASKTVVTPPPGTVAEGLQWKDLRRYHSDFHQNCTHLNSREEEEE